MDSNQDFYQNMNQLMELLKKMIHHLPVPPQKEFRNPSAKDANMNVQFCFFNFLPVTPDEMEELEDLYEQALNPHEDRFVARDFKGDLSLADLEFLRRHGIRY
jgi:hypothetical protein